MKESRWLAPGDRNVAEVLRHFTRNTPGGDLLEEDGLLLVAASRVWPSPYCDAAFRVDRDVSPSRLLERAGAFFGERDLAFCVWVAAHADEDLEAACVGAGLGTITEAGSPHMVIEHRLPNAVAEPPVTMREVTDDAGREAFVAVAGRAYASMGQPAAVAAATFTRVESLAGPNVRSVVAWDGDDPVSGAMVVVSDGVGGVNYVGTVPEARGRGLGELTARWATNAAFDLGAEVAALQASPMGEPVYRRMGYREITRYRWYLGGG
jgi:GNAT superfamily N-acetyltransferase